MEATIQVLLKDMLTLWAVYQFSLYDDKLQMLNQVYTDLYQPPQKLFPIGCTIRYYQVSLATTWNLQPESDFPFPKIHSFVEIPAIPESYFYLESPGNKYYD